MIKLHNVIIGYNNYKISFALNGIFKCGSITVITGNNGIGKTTLIKTIAGILPPVSGRVEFSIFRPVISYLSQQIELDRQFPLTVFDVVAMGCWPKTGLMDKTNDLDELLIWESLAKVKLDNKCYRNISILSSGEFQRMLFARLLVQRASVILLDEPFNLVDRYMCYLMITEINSLNRQGSTVVIVLHDKQLIFRYFSNVLFLSHSCYEWGTVSEISTILNYI